jgi:O-antigen ligase
MRKEFPYLSVDRVRSQQFAICLILGIVVVVQLLVATNPDSSLPAIPELVGIALLSGILCLTWGFGKTLQLPGWSIRQSEGIILSLVWLTVLGVTGSRAIYSLFHTSGQLWTPCLSLPGLAPKLECFFQASVYQNYGYRTFFTLVAAALQGTLAFLIARSVLQGWKLLFTAVVFGPLVIIVTGLFCIAVGIDQVLPRSLLYNSWGSERLTQIFSNPGWVWPYFAPGIAIVLWLTVATSAWVDRILYGVMSVVLILGVFSTQQRGGFLLCIVCIAVSGLYCLTQGLKKRSFPILTVGTTVLAVLGSGLYSFINNPKLLQELSQPIGYRWRPEFLSVDTSRLQMWQAAWEIFKEAPLFGHGYASWFQMVWNYGQRHDMTEVYDTAHNLYVQMLAELGLLHTLLVLGLLVLIAITVFQNTRFLSEGKLLFLLALSSFFIPTLVQEIDYIRPTFYIHAIFWGTLAGLPFHHNPKLQPSELPKSSGVQRGSIFSGSVRFIPSIGLAMLAGASILGVLFCYLNFSFGGYSFDARLSQPNTKIVRWLGPSVRLPSFATAEGKAYSVHEVMPLYSVFPEETLPLNFYVKEAESFSMVVEAQDQFFLALENGGRYLPQMHQLAFEPAFPDSRWLSLLVFYPPQQSNLAIPWSRGMYPWENFAGHMGRWCQKDCVFLAKSCGRRDRLDFALQSFRPDHSETRPLPITVSVYSLAEGSELTSTLLKHLPKPIAKVQAQLKKPGEEQLIHVDGVPGTAWYFVQVGAEFSINPYFDELSQDNRDLGVVIHEVDCRNSEQNLS